jgi:hypothetical protein
MSIQNAVVKELSEYSEFLERNPGLTLSQFAWMLLTPDLLIGTVDLLSPRFLMHKGGIFFSNGFSESRFDEWYDHYHGDLQQIERMMNHKHARGLIQFGASHSLVTVRFVAEIFAKFWRLSIVDQYPSLQVKVEIVDDIDSSDCTVCIYQGE